MLVRYNIAKATVVDNISNIEVSNGGCGWLAVFDWSMGGERGVDWYISCDGCQEGTRLMNRVLDDQAIITFGCTTQSIHRSTQRPRQILTSDLKCTEKRRSARGPSHAPYIIYGI